MTSRREFLACGAAAAGAAALGATATPPRPVFSLRGYYITFMRMPTYGLAQWKDAIDCFADDGANFLQVWMAGAFRSKKYPVTWRYNEAHENVRADFVRELIDYAHGKGVRVVLGFTPFGYDGVNQYPLEHPHLRATGHSGKPVEKFGIHCWGYNLCPSRPESRRFMLEYVREMAFDFYPNADGLLIESSDYGVCHCGQCRGKFFEHEFEFVRTISDEVWARKPQATVIVYPHYFSGGEVPGLGVKGAARELDPRWTLYFTPHSAHLDAGLIRRAKGSLWWDDSPALHGPEAVQRGARRAKEIGATGYVPSLEAFSFVATHPEEGEQYVVGRRQAPLGMTWLAADRMPYGELSARVNRIAYREFTRNPDLPFDEFKRRLGNKVFGADGAAAVDDLLELQRVLAVERTWRQASPVADPRRVRARAERGALKPEDARAYRDAVGRLRGIASRHSGAGQPNRRELHRIAAWLVARWDAADNARLLDVRS